jgi:hypothetical protein
MPAGMQTMAQTWHRGMESSGPLLIDHIGLPAIKTQPNITEGECTASVAPVGHSHVPHGMVKSSDDDVKVGAAGQRLLPHQLHPGHLLQQPFQASGPPSHVPSLGPNGLNAAQSQDLSFGGILDNMDNILEANDLETLPTGADAAALARGWSNGWPNVGLGGASSMELGMGFGAARAGGSMSAAPSLPMDDSWGWPSAEQHNPAWQMPGAPVPHGFAAGYQANHHHMPAPVGSQPGMIAMQLRIKEEEIAKLQQQLQQFQNGGAVAGMSPSTPALAASAVAAAGTPMVKQEYGVRKDSEFGGPSWIPHLKHGSDSSDDGELH